MDKQTAVDSLIKSILPFIDRSKVSDMMLQNIVEEHLEIEKEQHKETFKQSRQAKIFEKDMPPVWESFEQYYNETFKSE